MLSRELSLALLVASRWVLSNIFLNAGTYEEGTFLARISCDDGM